MNWSSEHLLPYTRTLGYADGEDRKAEWVAGGSILSYGVRIGIRTNTPELLDGLSEHFPPLWKPASDARVDRLFSLKICGRMSQRGSRPYHELFEDSEKGLRSRSLKTVLEDLERRMKMYVAEMARRRVFVHAGVVAWQGRAIVIPGRSLSGKTTLVAELVRAGATYYSDEYAVLDMSGRVHAYPQALQVRKPGSPKQKKHLAEEIGGITGSKPLSVGLVIVTKYKDDARWHPSKLSAGEALLELLQNTVPARRKPEVVLPTLWKAIAAATALKGARGEAEEVVGHILKERWLRNNETETFKKQIFRSRLKTTDHLLERR